MHDSLHVPLRGKPFGHFLLILPFALILAASTQPSLAEDAAATLTTLLESGGYDRSDCPRECRAVKIASQRLRTPHPGVCVFRIRR